MRASGPAATTVVSCTVPELPEIETIRAQLAPALVGRTITSIEASWKKSIEGVGTEVEDAVTQSIESVGRRGKMLLIRLDGGLTLLVHLRMSGQIHLVEQPSDRGGDDPAGPWTRVVIDLHPEARLVFNDQRKFGRILVVPTEQLSLISSLARLGPEPLETGFDASVLAARLARRPRAKLKAALLDQTTIAGLGNIYVDESLWRAGLSPIASCGDLAPAQIDLLASSIRVTLTLALEMGGSTARNYVDALGRRGRYLDVAAVYGRVGLTCHRCGSEIVKIRVAGRGTSLCPSCQDCSGRAVELCDPDGDEHHAEEADPARTETAQEHRAIVAPGLQ
jgi:formamidopyrimidine-DNA glycosylase